jgi:hypothetical protein
MITTLKHMQENGMIAKRKTARQYTHVLLLKVNNKTRIKKLQGERESRLAQAVKYARDQYSRNTQEIAAGVGGLIPYWPGQGGCDSSGRKHEQPEYQYNSAVEYMAKHMDLTGYIQHAIEQTEACLARDIEQAGKRNEDWHVVSWHSRADLARPSYPQSDELYKVERINNGVRS